MPLRSKEKTLSVSTGTLRQRSRDSRTKMVPCYKFRAADNRSRPFLPMDLSRCRSLWEMSVWSGHSTKCFDTNKDCTLPDWCGDEPLPAYRGRRAGLMGENGTLPKVQIRHLPRAHCLFFVDRLKKNKLEKAAKI